MRRIAGIFLICLTIIVSLSGCSGNKKYEKALEGDWTFACDITDKMTEALEVNKEELESPICLYFTLHLNSDKKTVLDLQREKTEESIHRSIMEINSRVREKIEEEITESGITLEKFEMQAQMSIEDLVDGQMGGVEETMQKQIRDIFVTGFWKADGKQLFLSFNEEGLSENNKADYVITDEGFSINYASGDAVKLLGFSDIPVFPINFVKETAKTDEEGK